jgi:phosphoglucomutase
MILGRNFFVTPSDSVAILAANADQVSHYRSLSGVARSMPTSRALDRVAKALDIPCYETPTGWKFFGNLFDAGMITLCGEESFGTGSDHIREKDGLWAVLYWLNILATRRESVADIVREHWRTYGRDYYTRHDYEELDTEMVTGALQSLEQRRDELLGQTLHGRRLQRMEQFQYTDPVDGSVSSGQGLQLEFDDDARIVLRLSGTGTTGSTLRIYIERHEDNAEKLDEDTQQTLRELILTVEELLSIHTRLGRSEPTVIT